MAKWSWKARLAQIEEACYMMSEFEDMPSWDDITLEEAIEIARDVAEHCDDENGDWNFDTYDKRNYQKAMKFIADFGS